MTEEDLFQWEFTEVCPETGAQMVDVEEAEEKIRFLLEKIKRLKAR